MGYGNGFLITYVSSSEIIYCPCHCCRCLSGTLYWYTEIPEEGMMDSRIVWVDNVATELLLIIKQHSRHFKPVRVGLLVTAQTHIHAKYHRPWTQMHATRACNESDPGKNLWPIRNYVMCGISSVTNGSSDTTGEWASWPLWIHQTGANPATELKLAISHSVVFLSVKIPLTVNNDTSDCNY